MLYLVFNTDPAMFNARRSQSNPIELQSFEWLRLGSVIELNWTHPTILPIEHNRTLIIMFDCLSLKQSNIIIKHCMQQSNIKPVSSGFKQKAFCSNKLRLHFQTQVHKDVTELAWERGWSQRAENANKFLEMMVKGYHECPLSLSVSVKSLFLRRKGNIQLCR